MKLPSENKKILIILTSLIIFFALTGIYIYNRAYYVIIRFDELGALAKNMPAYYNGFKIGKIAKISPDKDFKHTLVKVNLIHKNINLPQNTKVKVENFPSGEYYLQFIYPESPSLKTIQRGELLEGIAPYSLEGFMLGQSVSGVTDIVSLHIIRALDAMEVANRQMEAFFKATSKIINESDKEIKASIKNVESMTKSLADMAENLNQATKKINNSLEETELKDTTSSIKNTATNLAKATENIDRTVKKIDDTITHANATAENLNSITGGLKETLSQRFAGMRIMFGTPVKQKSCVKNCCK